MLNLSNDTQLRLKQERERRRRAASDGHVARYRHDAYPYDPIGYIKDWLKWVPWRGSIRKPGQADVLDVYTKVLRQLHEQRAWEQGQINESQLRYWQPGQVIKNRLRVEAGHTVGKCVAASEYLTLADGRRVQAGDLVGTSFKLPTLSMWAGQVISTDARAEWNMLEPVYALITRSGKRIVRNAQHPLWMAKGKFKGGKRPSIQVCGWTPLNAIRPDDLVAVTERLSLTIPNSSLSEVEVKLLAYIIGDGGCSSNGVVFSQEDNDQLAEFAQCATAYGCTLEHVPDTYDYRVYGKRRIKKKGSNPILNLLREHGVMGKNARTKVIPAAVFALPDELLRVFLSRLYSTDGWVSLREFGVEVGYASSSYELIRQVQELLVRLGVHGRIYYKRRVESWSLAITNMLDAWRFISEIGIYGKEEALTAAMERVGPRLQQHQANVYDRPDRPRWQYRNAVPGTRWERVQSVEYLGVEETVAIEVPGHETYLTSFWEHNTCLAAGIVSHFFDNFQPSIVYTFAPSWDQINDLLWKEVRVHRIGNGLPGRVLETPEIKYKANHFAKGKATNNATNAGIERTQGQHGKYLLFVLDEAVGIPEFVWKAVDTMTAGGISIVVMLANPRLRRGRFYKERESKYVHNFRISCLNHPNVVQGREVVPGAVRREWVDRMIEAHCNVVGAHDEDLFTFEAPWQPGIIYAPDNDFLYQVLGITPKFAADDTFVPVGRYEAALIRDPMRARTDVAYMGADTARYGTDYGTLYVRYAGRAWRAAQFYKQDSFTYYNHIKRVAQQLNEKGVKKLHIRLDGTGGFSSGVVDLLNMDYELGREFEEFLVQEIHFGSSAYDKDAYANIITEMYAEAAETLKGLRIDDPPDELEDDLCDRHYRPANKQGRTVKAMEDKDIFRKRNGRSPDDGDGFVLAVAPEHIFQPRPDEKTAAAPPRVVTRDELFG